LDHSRRIPARRKSATIRPSPRFEAVEDVASGVYSIASWRTHASTKPNHEPDDPGFHPRRRRICSRVRVTIPPSTVAEVAVKRFEELTGYLAQLVGEM
jgi:hypothetical protein